MAGTPIELCGEINSLVREYVPDHTDFNFIICNYYPDGEASIGYHCDNEEDYIPGLCICSLSIGRTRDFLVQSINTKETHKMVLEHGDVFIMRL